VSGLAPSAVALTVATNHRDRRHVRDACSAAETLFASRNTLFRRIDTLIRVKKYAVPVFRELCCNSLSSLADWHQKLPMRLINCGIPCSFPCQQGIWWPRPVRSGLPPPPRSPAQSRFPGGVGIVFDFPRLCARRGGIARSLPPGIGRCRQKRRPGLWSRQTVSRRNSRARSETGSNVGRDGFESGNGP
jgi:hypothetical protein